MRISLLLLLLTAACVRGQIYVVSSNNASAPLGVTNRNTATVNGRRIEKIFSTHDFDVTNDTITLKRTNVALKAFGFISTNTITLVGTNLFAANSYLIVSNAGTAAVNAMYTNAGVYQTLLRFNNTNGLYFITFNQTNSSPSYQGNPILWTSEVHSTPLRTVYYSQGFPYNFINQTYFPPAGTTYQMNWAYNGIDVTLATNPPPVIFFYTGAYVPQVTLGVDNANNLTIMNGGGFSGSLIVATNYVPANWAPVPGAVKLVPSNNWYWAVGDGFTNQVFQFRP